MTPYQDWKRPEPERLTRGDIVKGSLALAFFVMALIAGAIVGDRRQQAALEAEYAELEAERIALEHEKRSRWTDFPNESKCGRNCIARLPAEGETWEWGNE